MQWAMTRFRFLNELPWTYSRNCNQCFADGQLTKQCEMQLQTILFLVAA